MARANSGGPFIAPIEPIQSAIIDTGIAGSTSDAASGNGNDRDAAGTITVDPSSFGPAGSDANNGGAGDDTGRKRRGRKPGTRNAPKVSPTNIDALEALLLAVHGGLQFATGVEEIGIEKPEARSIAEAYAGVARHYAWLQTTEKALDWGRLFSALGIVYAPRLIAMRAKMGQTTKPPAAKAPTPPPTSPTPSAAQRSNGSVVIPGVGSVHIPPGAI